MTQKTTSTKALLTLGWYKYEIDLQDAQTLLEILNKARKLDRRYSDGEDRGYYLAEGKPDASISFLDLEVLDREPVQVVEIEPAVA